ncbi:MAG: peptide-methionine (R)-S-oxide reductase MsrB [Sphingomicrobium sp.]
MMPTDRRTFLTMAGAGLLLFAQPASAKLTFVVNHSPAEWRRLLGAQRFAVMREAATEKPYSSPLLDEHRRGTFLCAACAFPLFSSATKYDSKTGWPSFWRPLPDAIGTQADHHYRYIGGATEVLCRRCGGHIGHVFDDGPKPTGLRYCMNGVALKFRPA